MNKKSLLAIAILGLTFVLQGCPKKEEPAGDKVDQATDATKDAAETAGDKVEDATDKK